MAAANCFNLVYSSSATVYGEPRFLPITESHPTGDCTSPYGKSKYFTEEILKDLCSSNEVTRMFYGYNKCTFELTLTFFCI